MISSSSTLWKRTFALGLFSLLALAALAGAQTWTPLAHAPSFNASTALLLTDGSVMVQAFESSSWWRLQPDNTGSYINGTWSALASLPAGYAPLYYGSAVLPDGRVFVQGGEYNNNVGGEVWTNLGAIYDPASNAWTALSAPSGWSQIGDAQTVVLPNGTLMLANPFSAQSALLNASTLTWSTTGSGKADSNDEEGWVLLPNGKVLTVDANNLSNLTNSEIYDPATGSWSGAGSTIVKLPDTNANGSGSREIGPAVLRPDGTVFATGGTSNTAIYNSATGSWTTGPTFSSGLDVADGPAALLPDGNVLVDSSPGIFGNGAQFFEFNGSTLTAVPGPPNASGESSYMGRMLVLSTGQILFTDGSTSVEIYTPSGTYQSPWQPTISSFPASVTPGTASYSIAGTQLNGLSQGAMYGDDAQAATNYPLVRITNNTTNHVAYAKTHGHSTMGVATGATTVSTQFDAPASLEPGVSRLEVVANGIPSNAVTVQVVGSVGNALNSASYVAVVAADGAATLFGSGLTSTTASSSSNPLPTTLGGVSVTVGGLAAGLSYVSPSQINLVLPSGVGVGSNAIQVSSGGALAANGTANVQTVAPGIYSANGTGSGLAAGNWLRYSSSGTLLDSENLNVPINFGNPTDQVYLILYGTGFRHASTVSVSVGGVAGTVTYAGAQGNSQGLDQSNVLLPHSLAGRGSGVAVVLTANGTNANTVTVNIQ